MLFFVFKTNNLVLYTRTIPRSNSFDYSAIKRRKVEILMDNILGFRSGIRNPT
ncbi:MAG: hypothetical protein BWY82_03005 [Verrucomicrobia bacterium ADurb.Bin474]|nr:MAG: hypothetical protein BWY82_03005 [Verrucomicrobia bacterium ADurb.Bin474]